MLKYEELTEADEEELLNLMSRLSYFFHRETDEDDEKCLKLLIKFKNGDDWRNW